MRLSELGLNDGDLIIVERGKPQSEEDYEVSVMEVGLVDGKEDGEEDERVFKKEFRFKMRVG